MIIAQGNREGEMVERSKREVIFLSIFITT